MSNVTRRDAAKLAAGLALGAGGLTAAARSEEPKSPAILPDSGLERASKFPAGYMFADQVTTTLKSGADYDLIVTSATGTDGKPATVRVRRGTVQVFRAGPGTEEFTKKGGWTWTCGKAEGRTKFDKDFTTLANWTGGTGPLVLVVRQMDDTVHWYSLVVDMRC